MFLVGTTTQANGTTSYSNSKCYIGTDNELYSKGKTITGNRKIAEALGTVGSMSIMLASTGIGPAFVNGNYKTKKNVRKALYAVGATTIAAGTIKNIIDEDSNRKLRAYYSHSSKY